MHRVLRKLAAVGLLAMVVESGIGMVELAAGGIPAFVQINLAIFFTWVRRGSTLDVELEVEVLALALELEVVVGTLGVASLRHRYFNYAVDSKVKMYKWRSDGRFTRRINEGEKGGEKGLWDVIAMQ